LQHDPIAEVWGKPMTGDKRLPTRNWQLGPVRRVTLTAPTVAFVVAPFVAKIDEGLTQ